jgi:hypothetical protein
LEVDVHRLRHLLHVEVLLHRLLHVHYHMLLHRQLHLDRYHLQ